MPRILVVIPAFNEREHLPRLLDSVALARQSYLPGRDEVEIVVADNATKVRLAVARRRRDSGEVRVQFTGFVTRNGQTP